LIVNAFTDENRPSMAHLSRITVYPVKALDGLSVQQARVFPNGALEYDRRFALCDSDGRFINGKRTDRVHRIRSKFDSARRSLVVRMDQDERRFDVSADRPELEAWFGERIGRPVRLLENPAGGFPDDTNAPGPTVVATATLREVASWFPGLGLDEVRARFRANLELEGVEPFWEDRLYGTGGSEVAFQIGDVMFAGVNPCRRCVVPTRSPLTGEPISGFAKRFAERRGETLPAWADRSRFDHFYRLAVNTRLSQADGGTVRVGDAVRII
jgi:uncharacterized protein YcbX